MPGVFEVTQNPLVKRLHPPPAFGMSAMEFAHAAMVCAILEGEIRASISRTQRAIRDAQAAVQGMIEIVVSALTLGNAAAAQVRPIVWCKGCSH